MKISLNWLKELVAVNISKERLVELLSLRTQGGTKEVGEDYIELDLKGYNRADLFSMRGVAYEVAAITGSKITFREEGIEMDKMKHLHQNVPDLSVDAEDEKLCPVYCLAKIEGLKVKPSSREWIKKLESSGLRAVNNIADVTNLVMLEYGQPLHGFDARSVGDGKIIVRTAKKGEKITTLDGKTRDLETTDLLITDPQSALGIAGVMGGKDSEITDSTTTILLEAAIFDPVNIRKTSTKLKLTSESSKRFYHGLTKKRLLQALDAAIKMYQDLGGRLTAISLVGDLEDKPKNVKLTQEKINSLIGLEISTEQVESSLRTLGFTLASQGRTLQGWEVTVPYWRLDIDIEEDLVEEVARMYGYEKIPPQKLRGKLPKKIDQSQFALIYNLKKTLVDLGLTEVQTYSFFSSPVLNNLGWSDGDNLKHLIKIANPISKETEYLRYTIWPNHLESASFNLKRGFEDIAIFEIGKMYSLSHDEPKEGYSLAILLINNSDNPLAELYQIFKRLIELLILGIKVEKGKAPQVVQHLFHPNRFMDISFKDHRIGGLAEVHPRILDKFGISKRVAVLEIQLIKLL